MLHRTKTVLALGLLIICWPFACKDSIPSYSCDGILYDKPLGNIQTCVVGEWQIHYRKGGLAGNWKQSLANTYLTIRSNDSVYYVADSILRAKTRIAWKNTTTNQGKSTNAMTFNGFDGSPFLFVIEAKLQDTLHLSDNIVDGWGYGLTIRKK